MRRTLQGILDVLNWELSGDDYRALARLPHKVNSVDTADVHRSTGLLFDAELDGMVFSFWPQT